MVISFDVHLLRARALYFTNGSSYLDSVPVSTGVAFIDINVVVKAFAAGRTTLPSSAASIVTYSCYGVWS